MSTSNHSETGCTLPEQLRHYYLETMGIQVWQSLAGQGDNDDTDEAVSTHTV